MICFRDAELDAAARKFSWLGINKDTYSRSIDQRGSYKWYYDVEVVGQKYHGNSIMAAMALVSLKYLEQDNAYRRQIAAWYDAAFAGEPGIERVPVAPRCESSRHLYQIMVERRDELMLALNNAHIFPGVHYRDNTEYRMYGGGRGECPQARRASARLVSLPNHLRLSREDVERVAERVCASVRTMRSNEGASRAA
jgi:dTDP-4-amino-4,6-dideoxygalactose transaminase